MDRIITENDLLLYHYKEVEFETYNHIQAHLSSNQHWQEYLKLLLEVDNSLQKTGKGLSNTTMQIIMEESIKEENPTF